jgi:hypothetical protein
MGSSTQGSPRGWGRTSGALFRGGDRQSASAVAGSAALPKTTSSIEAADSGRGRAVATDSGRAETTDSSRAVATVETGRAATAESGRAFATGGVLTEVEYLT